MLLKRTWIPCLDTDIRYLYDGVWEYINEKWGYTDKPRLYLNTSKSVRQLGLFSFDRCGNTAITLNQLFVRHKESVLNTIVHEFAHYLTYKRYGRNCGHNARWHLLADELGDKFGEKITTYCSHNHEVLQEARELKPKTIKNQISYEVKCNDCGHTFTYGRQRWWFKDKTQISNPICTCPYCKNHSFSIIVKRKGEHPEGATK